MHNKIYMGYTFNVVSPEIKSSIIYNFFLKKYFFILTEIKC